MSLLQKLVRGALMPLHELFRFLGVLFERYKFARRALLVWACWLVTVVVFKTFENFALIDAPKVTAIATMIAVLTTVIGFYQWDRSKDDGE